MKIKPVRAFVVATSIVALSSAAFAVVDPIYGGENPELDQLCSDLQRPAANSDFVSYAEDIISGATSSVTVDGAVLSTVGIGSPSYTISNYRDAHVNGQSVNIHAFADKVATYSQGAMVTVETVTTITTTTSAACHVHKPTQGNENDPDHPGYQIAPPGQQTTERVSISSVELEYGTRTYAIPGPWIDPDSSEYGGKMVICISPTQPPPKGTWRGQNGYTNQIGGRTCSTAWHNELGSSQPTASLPAE